MNTPRLPKLKARKIDGHKGTFGTVGVIGGSVGSSDSQQPRMIGAPALVAMGANRSGCGLVKIAAPDSILNAVLTLSPMATGFSYICEEERSAVLDRMSAECDVLVVGPGLGAGADIQRLMTSVTMLAAKNRRKRLVLDADAINALCTLEPFPTRFTLPTILTPHPGEAKRLLDALHIDLDPAGDASQRSLACRSIAERLNCIVVLKGMHTVVSDGQREWVSQHGHPCLSTGGTGDVLAGMIGSLVAQCLNDPDVDDFGAACIAVDTHARCGEVWSQRHNADAGLDPRDLMPLIPELLQRFRNLPMPR